MSRDDKPDTSKPRVKKSETLEVRIPYETKVAFLNACREDGTTASEVVREQVQSYLDARARPSQKEEKALIMKFPENIRRYGPRAAAGGMAAVGLVALAALPSAAAPDFKAQFSRLDANSDGVLSVDEFLGPEKADGEEKNVVIETRTVTHSGDKPPADIKIEPGTMKKEAFAFYLPEEFGAPADGKTADQKHEYKFISRIETKDVTAHADGAEPKVVHKTMSFSMDDIRKEEFASIDKNSDGKVSLDEYRDNQTAMLTRGFEILDKDGDKSLSQAEYATIVAPPVVKLDWQGGPDMPEPPKIEIPGAKAVSPETVAAAFNRLDGNKDGKLSLQEYLPKS